MSDKVLDSLNEMDEQVQDGEIAGFVPWPLTGKCSVESVGLQTKNGNPYFAFKLKSAKGAREFMVRIPKKTDKEAAKFMGMQKIYSTLYAFGAKVGKDTPQDAYSIAKDYAGGGEEFEYKLEEYESFSEKTGRSFTNQSLSSLELIGGEFN